MKHIKDLYPMVKQVRQRIVETMQERGLTEVVIMPDREEWLKQNPDKYEEDYDQACYDECPYVVYFDKYGCGYEYMVKKVELIGKDALGFPCFRMECEANELGYDRFTDDDVYDMKGVYEVLEKRLGIDEDPEKVWLVKQESNDDGEIHFFVEACRDKATAVSILQEWKDALLTKHPKYVDAKPYIDGEKDPDDQMCCYEWENEDEDSFYIKVLGDDYHELLTIEEKEII